MTGLRLECTLPKRGHMLKLCVNIDHIATVREARKGREPDPVHAAVLCELAGAYGITFHLREDRRHIQERDVRLLKELIHIKLNMEMANTKEMVSLAKGFIPHQVTLVPEKRQELTTEGGLDVARHMDSIKDTVEILQPEGISVSLFIDPASEQIDASAETGAKSIELHTGLYCNAKNEEGASAELEKLKKASVQAHESGLAVYAGHGLNYQNIRGMLEIPYLEELNIGHSIVSRAVFVGIEEAVREMIRLAEEQPRPLKE